jgi:hypothetical protein
MSRTSNAFSISVVAGTPPPPGGALEQDWAARATVGVNGVFLAKRWQTNTDIDPWPTGTETHLTLETRIKRSGMGALRFAKLVSDGADMGLTRILLGQTRGNGTETWYQISVYFPEAAVRYKPQSSSGEGGQKMLWVSGGGNASNTNNEVVSTNSQWRGFASGYHSNGGAFEDFANNVSTPSHPGGLNATYSNAVDRGAPTTINTDADYESRYGIIYYSNAVGSSPIPAPGDIYAQGFPSPFVIQSGLPRLQPDAWTTLQFRIKIGTLGTASSEVDLWVARSGQPFVKQFGYTGVTLGTENGGHGAVWVSAYETNRTANSPGMQNTFCCFTELIASTQNIAAPAVVQFAPGYSLPTLGTSLRLSSTNTLSAIRPAVWDQNSWLYSIINSYGFGAFNEYYSLGGAMIVGCTGGHQHPDFTGAAAYDFTDLTWKLHEHQNGGVRYSPGDLWFDESETNGSPYREIPSTTGNVPAPGHPCQTQAIIPPQLGGGPKGSFASITRGSMGVGGILHSGSIHRFDLSTNLWSRVTNNLYDRITTGNANGYEVGTVFDAGRKRYWQLHQNDHELLYFPYLDASNASMSAWAYSTSAAYGGFQSGDIGNGARLWMFNSCVFMQNAGSAGGTFNLRIFDPANPSLGWRVINVSGALPATFSRNAYAYYPRTGSFYLLSQFGGSSIGRLRPPSNLSGLVGPALVTAMVSGTWVSDTVTINPALPRQTNAGDLSDLTENYTALTYVPSINRLAWFIGDDVYLLDPT